MPKEKMSCEKRKVMLSDPHNIYIQSLTMNKEQNATFLKKLGEPSFRYSIMNVL